MEAERFESIKAQLQALYGGRAKEYENSKRADGQLFPPHGMCNSDSLFKLIQSTMADIKEEENNIQRLEDKLLAHGSVVLPLVHPMIVMQPSISSKVPSGFSGMRGEENRDRGCILLDIAKAHAKKRMAEDMLTAYKAVTPVSDQYMVNLKALFEEKRNLGLLLFERGILLSEW